MARDSGEQRGQARRGAAPNGRRRDARPDRPPYAGGPARGPRPPSAGGHRAPVSSGERSAGPPRSAERVFLTTQPGWAFATLAELRGMGIGAYVDLLHRDSTLVVDSSPELVRARLKTAADAYGLVVSSGPRGQWDAARGLAQALRQMPAPQFQPRLWHWLMQTHRTRAANYSVGSEVWGETGVHRRDLGQAVRNAMRAAFPRLREQPAGGVRLLCKADTQAALMGAQLYSNLAEHGEMDEGRPGSLREHLACGLLTVAGVQAGEAVLDPFMGTGTILRVAAQVYDAGACIGAEVDRTAFRVAEGRVPPEPAELRFGAFDGSDPETLPEGTRLVSNLPFGVRFAQVETERLLAFLQAIRPKLAGLALLMGREQAEQVAAALRLRTKNVLVLGQPATVVYGDPQAEPAKPARVSGRPRG